MRLQSHMSDLIWQWDGCWYVTGGHDLAFALIFGFVVILLVSVLVVLCPCKVLHPCEWLET